MRVLLVGLGQIGLGLIVPVFQEAAGYEIVGTDASADRLDTLRNEKGYILWTPKGEKKIGIDTVEMCRAEGKFDAIITAVGRQHLSKVAAWCQEKHLSAPVFLAENLPDPVSYFPQQLPMVVDRISARMATHGTMLSVIAENYHKIITLNSQATRLLEGVSGVELLQTAKEVEEARLQKMFTINTSHILVAIFGSRHGWSLVEEAAADPIIVAKIHAALSEIGTWLDLDGQKQANRIIERFLAPIQDPLSRLLKQSSLRYVEVPLYAIRSLGMTAPTLEEAQSMFSD